MQARVISSWSASCSSHIHPHRQTCLIGRNLRPSLPLRILRPSATVVQPSRDTSTAADRSACRVDSSRLQTRLAVYLAAAALSVCLVATPAAAFQSAGKEPFLTATGAQGLLKEQEAELFRLREEKEGEVRAELDRAREELEQEGRSTQIGKLCATPFGVDIVGITELIALIGALVGGVTARQRKVEVERLNEQLRKINSSLRKQARAGTLYAPGLTYIPADASGVPQSFASTDTEDAAPSATATAQATAAPAALANGVAAPESPPTMKRAASLASMQSIDEDEMSTEARQCLTALREGKRLLKEGAGAKALVHFEKALMLAKFLGNKVQERRAVRGLAAASRLQGQFQAAINHLQRVLEISNEMGDHVGDADAYGTIADIYTDMGDFDRAASMYDKYINAMATDGPV